MGLFSKKPNISEQVLDEYTGAVTNWCQAMAGRERQSVSFAQAAAAVGAAPQFQANRITNEVSRDMAIVTARKWLAMEVGKFSRRSLEVNPNAGGPFWDEVSAALTRSLPRTTTL